MTFAPIQNRLGVQPIGTTVTCVNKSGTSVAIGDLVITSFIHAGAVVDPQQAANTGYVFNCIRKAVSTETGNTGYLGVVTGLMAGAGGNGREVEVQFGGICSAKVLVNATVTSGTLLSVSTTAGVLSNVASTSDYSVTLMDNAAVADGTALKRVYIPQEYSFNTREPGVYGSNRAGRILADVISGTDSVDIVVFGDSNAGSSASCGYGVGWQKAMAAFGAPVYATPLAPSASDDGSNTRNGGLFMPWNDYYWGGRSNGGSIGTQYSLTNRIAAAADTDATALNTLFDNYFVRENTAIASSATTLQLDAGASSTNGDYVGNYISILDAGIGSNFATSSGVVNFSTITAYNGTTKTATVSPWAQGTPSATASFIITRFLLRPNSFNHAVAFVPAGSTYTSPAGGPSVRLIGGNQLASGTGPAGVALQYRVVYGKFATTGGKFRLRAMKGVNTLVAGSADFPTSGGIGYATAALPFTSTTTSAVPDQMKCAWDGYNSGDAAYVATGPLAIFYHSVIRTTYKGFCVSVLNYFGGASTEFLGTTLVRMPKYLEAYLKELRERQIVAGGSGRIVWWHNTGINGAESGSTWTTNANIIRDQVYNVWVNILGYPANDLAFVMSVTHPTVAGESGADPWSTSRAATSTAVSAWATANANDGKNVTVVDIESILTAAQIKSRNLYQVLDNNLLYSAHLRNDPLVFGSPTYSPTIFTGGSDGSIPNNGYAVITTGIVRKLLADV